MTLSQLRNKIQGLDLARAVVNAIEVTREQYLDRQREQFARGERADETSLGGYSLDYAAKRRRYGLQTEVKDLNFTGGFYGSMMIEAFPDTVNITSDVDYEKWIDYHYNKNKKLYGLNQENLEAYRREEFWPALKEEITAQSGLNFK